MECGLSDVFRDNNHFKMRNSSCEFNKFWRRRGEASSQRCPVRRLSPGEVSLLRSHLELGSLELPGCLLSLKILGWECACVSLFPAPHICVDPVGSRYAAGGLSLGRGLEVSPQGRALFPENVEICYWE